MHPVLFELGEIGGAPVRITGYGVMMLLAMIAGWALVRRLGRRVDPEAPWTDLVLGLLIAGLGGAKLLLVIVHLPDLLAGRAALGDLLLAGGVWLGGVAGAALYAAWFFRRFRLEPGRALNVLFVAVPLGHAIGRLGCVLAGCCYGEACTLPWAITYTDPLAHELSGTPLGVPLHPSPLYEALAELFNFAVCLTLWRRRAPPWSIPAAWLALYGTERFLLEFLRGDARGALGPLSTSQWLALAMIALAAALWATRVRRARPPTS